MFDEIEFNKNIENIKNDLKMEGMFLTDQDINVYKQYNNKEINMEEMLNILKNSNVGDIN
jgi:hypothetical protein